MSDEDSGNEDFLARWSRRKQEARAGQAAAQPEQPVEPSCPAPSVGGAEGSVAREFDLSSLPAIDSIDAATDIRAFLRDGIPEELSRAALRRAWSADPAIRDFMGLAENAWDFNDPHAMPGFGPLDYSAEQVEALVRRVVGGMTQAVEGFPDPDAEAADTEKAACEEVDCTERPLEARPVDESVPAESQPGSVAPQSTAGNDEEESFVRRRTHGSALPR
jgi:uncharacterized protein DUF3306